MIDFFYNVPVIAKVLGSLGLILVINGFTRMLTVALVVAIVVLGLWCGHPLGAGTTEPGLAAIAWNRFASVDNFMLLVVVYQVVVLSSQMAACGVMKDLVETVRARISTRASMAVLPAVIGWLPMPGGALFSAPMLDQCDPEGAVDPLIKTQTNYWFRHIWEYWWPLYPGVLLAIGITGLELWQFVLLQAPLTLMAVAAGYIFLLRRIHTPSRPGEGKETHHFLALTMPIIITIATYAAVKGVYAAACSLAPGLPPLQRYLPMLIGLCIAMAWLQWRRPLPWPGARAILLSSRTARLALLVALVRIFGALIEAKLPGGLYLPEVMRQELDQWHVPLELIVVLLPFISGLSTGLTVGYVGASFPVVISLLGASPATSDLMATIVLAYVSGFMGMMLSPVHICLIVTNEHFSTRLFHSIGGLAKPALLVLLLGALYHLAIRL